MANEDRHYGNFGLLRDPHSLETKGFAPLFDTGSSLGYKAQSVWIREGYDPISKPFKPTHGEQIRLVRSFDWLDLDKLDGIERYVVDVFHDFERIIDNDRAHTIAGYVRTRIEKLRGVMDSHPGFHDGPRTDLTLAAE